MKCCDCGKEIEDNENTILIMDPYTTIKRKCKRCRNKKKNVLF